MDDAADGVEFVGERSLEERNAEGFANAIEIDVSPVGSTLGMMRPTQGHVSPLGIREASTQGWTAAGAIDLDLDSSAAAAAVADATATGQQPPPQGKAEATADAHYLGIG